MLLPFILLNLILIKRTAVAANENSVCITPGCRKASTDILSFIDPSVDPCQDFYKFTCSGIFKKTHENKPVSLEAMVSSEVEEQIKTMLSKPIASSEPKAFQTLKRFFNSCMDDATIERDGLTTLKSILSQAGGWPVLMGQYWDGHKFNLEESIIKLRKMGLNYMQLFYFGVAAGEDRFFVGEPILHNIEDQEEASYFEYILDVIGLFGVDKQVVMSEMQEMLKFKMQLLRISEQTGVTQKSSIKHVQKKNTYLNWSHLINNIIHPNKHVSEGHEVYFPSQEYLTNLGNLLSGTNNRTLTNFLLWEVIEGVLPYLPSDFGSQKLKFSHSITDKREAQSERRSRLDFCKNEVRSIFPPTFEAMYVRDYFSPERSKSVLEIVLFVKTELIKLLNNTALYDDETRKKAIEKATALTYFIGGPPEVFDEKLLSNIFDKGEDIDTRDFVTLATILNRQHNNFRFKLGSRLHEYYDLTVRVNAFYDHMKNIVMIPAAVLQGLYYNENRPHYLNFGTVGTVVAHELTHAFTEYGSNFDKHGNHVNMWSNKTRSNFEKRATCLITEASNFQIEGSHLRMDGKQILEESTCDFTGVLVAYRAYNSWLRTHGEEKELPGLNYNTKQLYWISTATFFCDTVTLDTLKEFIDDDKHAHPTFRTFGALSNNVHFGDDFNCPLNRRMNPAEKCQIF